MKMVRYSAFVLAAGFLVWSVPAAQADCGKCKPAEAAGKCVAPCSQPGDKAACAVSEKCVKEGCCAKGEGCCAKGAKGVCPAASQPADTVDKGAGGCCPKAAAGAGGSCGKVGKG